LVAATIKTFAAAGLLVACGVGIAALTGWLVFEIFGAVTMIVVYTVAMAMFLLVSAGLLTARIATHFGQPHPVVVAIGSSGLLALSLIAVTRNALSDDFFLYFASAIVPLAALRAWQLTRG
jgi:hypothetical protein